MNNHSYRGYAISITYYKDVFLALSIQLAKRTRHIVICSLPGSTMYFFTLSYQQYDLKKNSY
jgi:hypothetical protein